VANSSALPANVQGDLTAMAALIPGAGELILPEASHFAFIQDPAMFNLAVLHFLALGNNAHSAPQKEPNLSTPTGSDRLP